MPLFSSRKHDHEHTPDESAQSPVAPPEPGGNSASDQSGAVERKLPPHMQRIVDERSAPRVSSDPSVEEQRDAYERRRISLQFDIDQGELASSPDNPWSHRIELLTEALVNVEEELRQAEQVVPGPYHPLPATPITGVTVQRNDGISLSFRVGDHAFAFEEVLDWAERGTQLARPELVQVEGDAAGLVPEDTPPELVAPFEAHLRDSVVTFATDLRDRTLDEEPLPGDATLADLARPCATCGGWSDWKGSCDTCSTRKARAQDLFRERTHLLRERANEAEERHRLADRLPLARHRMRDLQNEFAAWERSLKQEE
jgi:hypothetical protein